MTPEKTVKPKRTRQPQSEAEPQPCHVHDECGDHERQGIQESVCRDLITVKHTDGNHYCLLHQPTKEKDADKFQQIIDERFDEIAKGIAKIEAELPEAEQEEAKAKLNYDFRYVWFTTDFSFENKVFSNCLVNFISAMFNGSTKFKSAVFNGQVNFMAATFDGHVDFTSTVFKSFAMFRGFSPFKPAIFKSSVTFLSTTFDAHADFTEVTFERGASFSSTPGEKPTTFGDSVIFNGAKFKEYASFQFSVFSGQAMFHSTKFCFGADFFSSKFLEKSQIGFYETRFCSNVRFEQTEFDGFVEFTGDVFLDKESVQRVKAELEVERIEDGQESFLDFRKARLNRPERITFNSMKLRPSWFVGGEVRSLVFNDVKWLNLDIDVDKSGLNAEFENLTKHNTSQPKESLIKACNQLADNAEANRRFEEAKQFRKQGIALQNKDCYVHFEVNPDKKPDIRKKVCRHYPVVNEDGGRYYCLWHNPDADKSEVFREQFDEQKYTHTDYQGVVFTCNVIFDGNRNLDNLDFHYATFQKQIAFENVVVADLKLRKTYFTEDAELLFKNASCKGWINLNRATFEGKLNLYKVDNYKFFTGNGRLSAVETKFDKPNWITFRNVRLLPEYFFDVDSSKFTFHDCKWIEENENYLKLNKSDSYQTHKQIAQTCNYLAINYEENRHFEESSMFRYASMDSKRLSFIASEKKDWFKRFNLLLYRIYKWTSGYGESWSWAMGVLIGLLILFGYLYSSPLSAFDYGKEGKPVSENTVAQNICDKVRLIGNPDMNVCEGIVHSLSVATFQRPEPKAYDTLTKLFVALEVILAPLQAALLALAIRRKFMR